LPFLKAGFLALGGGISMLPYLEEIARRELGADSDEFLQIMAVAQSFPGAMGINAAAIIGYRMGGWKGALAGVLGVTVPGVICASGLFVLLVLAAETSWLDIATTALKAAVVGIVLGMAVNLGNRSWKGYRNLLVGIAAMLLFYRFQISPVIILLGAGVLGYIFLSTPEAG